VVIVVDVVVDVVVGIDVVVVVIVIVVEEGLVVEVVSSETPVHAAETTAMTTKRMYLRTAITTFIMKLENKTNFPPRTD